MKAFIPKNFNFDSVLPDEKKYKDKYFYIIHKILQDRVYNKNQDFESYIPLQAIFLRYIIGGYHLNRIIENLINEGVIERNRHYIPGVISIGYRICEFYRGKGIKEVEITDKRINTRVKLFRNKRAKELPDGIEYQSLKKWLNEIEIDYDNAVEYIKLELKAAIKKEIEKLENLKIDYSPINILQIFNCLKFLVKLEEIKNNISTIQDKFDCALISIKNIKYNDKYIKVDDQGRVHTNITNLKSELRKFLRYKGKRLYNIDIRNSQPFLFNLLIKIYLETAKKSRFFTNNKLFYHKINSFSLSSSSFKSISNNNQTSNILSYDAGLHNIDDKDCNNNDLELYLKLTSSGKFYEYLMDKMNIDPTKRKEYKKTFFGKVFFSKNNDNYVHQEKKDFKKLFPNIYKIIYNYKKDNYKNLPIMLQKAESNIMINGVCKKITKERPNIFITSIHDSIMTTMENIEYVKNKIMEEFEKYNLKPSLKEE